MGKKHNTKQTIKKGKNNLACISKYKDLKKT